MKHNWLLAALFIVSSGGFVSCAKEEFVRQRFAASGSAAGFRFLPAKVDIVVVPDNTGSITQGYTTVTSQLSSFVSSLQNQDWDYHLMKSNISQPAVIDRALVNPVFNGPTLPDGSPNLENDWVPGNYAVTDASQFPLLTSADIDPQAGSVDSTVSNTYSRIQGAMSNTNAHFIRPDSLLAIIVITNGVDGNLIQNPNDAFSPVSNGNVSAWANSFKGLKGSNGNNLVRFYAIASPNYISGTGCYGGSAYSGAGYHAFITQGLLKGFARNFCDPASISGVLSSIANDLQTTRQSYIFSSIVLPYPAVPSSIRVYKNGQLLANSASNGWTYSATKQTVFTVTGIRNPDGSVTALNANARTGYPITLHGSAQMLGSDQPSLDFERQ